MWRNSIRGQMEEFEAIEAEYQSAMEVVASVLEESDADPDEGGVEADLTVAEVFSQPRAVAELEKRGKGNGRSYGLELGKI